MNFRMTFSEVPGHRAGEVWLVGAGPGDPRLLTVMAIHALRSADCIIHDALIDMRVLKLANPAAEILSQGKRGGKPSAHQHDINDLIIAEAKRGAELSASGRRPVRLRPRRRGGGCPRSRRHPVPRCPGLTSGFRARHSQAFRDHARDEPRRHPRNWPPRRR